MLTTSNIHRHFRIARVLLVPFSLLYGLIVFVRNRLYDTGVFPSFSFQVPVIGVGNLSMGGTGKTPHIEYLIRLLGNKYRLAVLSRGYGRKSRGFLEVTPEMDATLSGDEPLQMKRKFPEVTIAVCEQRKEGIEQLLARSAPDVVLLDDNFQHRRVNAGFQILLTSYAHPFWRDCMFPAGYLRDNRFESRRADVVVVTKCPEGTPPLRGGIIRQINKPLFYSILEYQEAFHIDRTHERLSLAHAQGAKELLLVSGIASPAELQAYLRSQGHKVSHLRFGDHHAFSMADLQTLESAFMALHNTETFVITTEKDAARLSGLPIAPPVRERLFVLPVNVSFGAQEKQFAEMIQTFVEVRSVVFLGRVI